MSVKPDVKAVPEAEVRALLRRVGEAPVDPRNGDEQDEREARFAAQIDAKMQQLASERSRSRRSRALLVSLAAALPLGFLAARAAQRPGSVLALSREPAPSAARSAALPRSLPSALEPRAAIQVSPPRTAPRAPLAPVASGAPSDTGAATSASTLAAENGLFQDAVNNAHAGHAEQALRGFEQLLQSYPRSPLAQTALVRKFRVLSGAGRINEARTEARRYLQLYPTGFGQREAEIVLNGQTSLGDADAGDSTESP
ncbi:MAG: hypothetical protein ABJB12_16875 [Pseudomonadota bacterium]